MEKGEEKRRYKRISKPFVARFQVRPQYAPEKSAADWNMVTLQDLGAGGILFHYNEEIKVGALIDLRINFPASPLPVSCTGKVIRVERPGGLSVFRVAAVFVEIGEEDKELLIKAAEEFYLRKSQQAGF